MRAYAYPACRMLDDWTCFTCGQEQSGTVLRCSACQEPLCSDCVSKHRHSGFQVTWGTGDPDEPGNIQANEFYPDAEAVRGIDFLEISPLSAKQNRLGGKWRRTPMGRTTGPRLKRCDAVRAATQ